MRKSGSILKGTSSGLLISIAVHIGAFFVAGALVVISVVVKPEAKFTPPVVVKRPKMQLKKPKVKVKKSKPKPSSRIMSVPKAQVMPDIVLPEMGGFGEGFGNGAGFGTIEMPDLEEVTIFGGSESIGSDFEGEVYSLLHKKNGSTASMDQDAFRDILRKYVVSGWKDRVLAQYYRSPKKMYTTHFMVPPIPTAMAPGVFGVPELEDYYLFIKYEGQLAYPRDIKFRFWGIGDAYIFVNVGGKEVLMSTWHMHHPWFDWWTSTAAGDRTHILGNQRMVGGDWIELKAGEPLDMKVLYGEWKGGQVAGMLLVEVDGVDYPSGRNGMPRFPAFKTEQFSWDTMTQISRFLAEDECSLAEGPIFNDYHDPEAVPAVAPEVPDLKAGLSELEAVEVPALRMWSMADGRSLEAELMTVMRGHAVFKNKRGTQIKLAIDELAEEDQQFIRFSKPPKLKINFSKTTAPRKFGATINAEAPPVRGNFYTFRAEVKKASRSPYDFDLSVEYFAIGDEIGGDKHILLDRQKETFRFSAENNDTFELCGSPVELLDYTINNERRGQRYGACVVVVRDEKGTIIAQKVPNKKMLENLDNLSTLKVGWYFDDEAKPCLPTPPEYWAEPANTN